MISPSALGFGNPKSFRRTAPLLLLTLILFAGCGARQVLVVPDYGNPHYDQADLHRPDLVVVETADARGNAPNRVGTAQVGMFNNKVPYLLDEPVADFITRSVNTMVGAEPDALRMCPVTIRIDELSAGEHTGLFKEEGSARCRMHFSFPVDPESFRTVDVSTVRTGSSMADVTGSLEDLLYESVADCTRQFLEQTWDPAPVRWVTDREGAAQLARTETPSASPPTLARPSGSSPAPQDDKTIWQRLSFDYVYFTNSEMQDAYPHGFGGTWGAQSNLGTGFRQEFEMGFILAGGTPVKRPETLWTVDSSSLTLVNLPIRFHLIYPPRNPRGDSFRPYVGAGLGAMLGFERMSAELTWGGGGVDVANGIFRAAWTGDVIVGSEFGPSASAPFVELRFQFSGHNNVAEGLSDEDKQERAETLYDALVRPNGETTGVQLSVGMCW